MDKIDVFDVQIPDGRQISCISYNKVTYFDLDDIFDILPRLKAVGFLDTDVRNPDITIDGITLALQFGNALPKYITGRKNITIVDCAARRAYPRAISQRQVFINKPAFTSL